MDAARLVKKKKKNPTVKGTCRKIGRKEAQNSPLKTQLKPKYLH